MVAYVLRLRLALLRGAFRGGRRHAVWHVLAGIVADGNAGHARIPGKHGTAAVELAVVVVQVPDRPGEIGRILAAMGEAGVNLEDLRIEHVPGRRIGLAEISVLPAALEEMLALLERGGWTVAA